MMDAEMRELGLIRAVYTAPARAMLKKWGRQGLTLREMRERMHTLRFNTHALAAGLHHVFERGFFPPASPQEEAADVELLALELLDAVASPAPEDDHAQAANPYGCNQYRHAPGCEHEGGAGNTIEITYEPEKKSGAEWIKDAQQYFMEHYAGRSYPIGNTGHTLHVGSSKSRTRLASKGVNTQKRNAAFKQLEDVIARASHLSSEEAKTKDGQGHHKADIIAKTATFEKYGAPATINGEKCLIWFNAQTKEKGAKDVLLYEFGVSPLEISKEQFRAHLGLAQVTTELLLI